MDRLDEPLDREAVPGRREDVDALFRRRRPSPSRARSAARSPAAAGRGRAPAPRTFPASTYSAVSAAAISNSSCCRRVRCRHASRLSAVAFPGSENDGRPRFVSSVAFSSTSSGIFIGSTATGAMESQSTVDAVSDCLLVSLDAREADLVAGLLGDGLHVALLALRPRLRRPRCLNGIDLERHAEDLRDLLVELAVVVQRRSSTGADLGRRPARRAAAT